MDAAVVVAGQPAVRRRAGAWYVAVAVLFLCAVVYGQTWANLWPLWMDTEKTTYTHGLLIAGVSAWLVWRSRQLLATAAIQPVALAIPLVLLVSLAWMVSAKAGVLTVEVALWPVLAWLTVLAACGWPTARVLAFPLAYLWFAMPLLEHLNRALQSVTVLAVDALNRVTMIPATVSGDVVTIPSGQFHIAAGCSGLHFFIVGLAIAALAGEIHRDRLRTRLLLLVVGGALAMLANWLRVYFVILAGYATEMQHSLVHDHYRFGWVVFAVTMVLFFWFVRMVPADGSPPAPTAGPEKTGRPLMWAALAVAAALLLPGLSALSVARNVSPPGTGLLAVPLDGFTGPVSPSPAWRPLYHGPDSEIRAAYLSRQGRVMDFYGNRYLTQSQGRELIGYANRLLREDAFRERARSTMTIETAQGQRSVTRIDALARSSGEDWVFLYHFVIGDTWLHGNLAAQLLTGWRSLWGTTPAGIRAVAAPCRGDCASAAEDLAGLLAGWSRSTST